MNIETALAQYKIEGLAVKPVLITLHYSFPSCQNATALAAATFKESTS